MSETTTRVELALRESDGRSVALYWTRETNLLAVVVLDWESGSSFEIVLEPHERPLDVYYHPYSYAAQRGLDDVLV